MSTWQDRVVVVTGASAGIGACLAEQIAAKGGKQVLLARRDKELSEVAGRCGEDALAVVADVTRREDLSRALEAAIERFGHVDVWVNNAGRGISRPVSELTDEDFDEMMLVNTKSVLWAMQTVLPHYRERGAGHIINVSSLLGRLPLAPIRSAYSAAKHALNALSSSLRLELRDTDPGIHVSVVSPGVVATEFGLRARHGGYDSRGMPGAQSPEEVAEVIVDVIEHPRADAYTRPIYRDLVASYYAAEDLGARESLPPFGPPKG